MRIVHVILVGGVLLGAPAAIHADAELPADVFVLLNEPGDGHRVGAQTTRREMRREMRRATRRATRRVLDRMPAGAVRAKRSLSVLGGFTATCTDEGRAALERDPEVLAVDSMQRGGGGLAQSVPLVHGDIAHRRGATGIGVRVAVLDSGIEVDHPDVAGRVVGEQCFCHPDCCPNGLAEQSGAGSAATRQRHGIHVTGIVASAGEVAPVGVAPEAEIVAVKVLDEDNRGVLSDWVFGLDWVLAERPDVQVVNMSLVSDSIVEGVCDNRSAHTMGFARAIRALRERGVLTFVAAGNNGEPDRLTQPACIEAAVAVGSLTKRGDVARGSNSGPVLDLFAPGVGIASDGVDGSVTFISGTSMASPHAAGLAALLLEVDPELSADETEQILKRTGVPTLDDRNGLTRPRIDVARAHAAVGPLWGGSSGARDCYMMWDIRGALRNGARPEAFCVDDDPACDWDERQAVCGFEARLCFGSTDKRLPACEAPDGLVEFRLLDPPSDGDAFDLSNRSAILAAVPGEPISGALCTEPIELKVPVGVRWLRASVEALDGQRDVDKLRLRCGQRPRPPEQISRGFGYQDEE